jgi:transcriptional regulator with XRE-family HTH domain
MGIGENLKTIRKKLNLSQNDLAEIFQVSTRMVGFYEKDQYPVNSDALERLIKKYNINPQWLFLNQEQMLLNTQDDKEINYIIEQAGSKNIKQALLDFLKIVGSLRD